MAKYSVLSFLPNLNLNPILSKTFKMSDTNDTRLPITVVISNAAVAIGPYVGDDVNPTLTRGDK